MICVFINMTGTPKGSTESGFMEKPGIVPATPGLQGIALIHYTTGASQISRKMWQIISRSVEVEPLPTCKIGLGYYEWKVL